MDIHGPLVFYILFITVIFRVKEVSPTKFIFGGEARRVCEAYKRVCSAGKVCALQTIEWPRTMKFPVCVYRQHKRVKSSMCKKAPQPGRCAAKFTRWYYNIHMQACSWFVYSGCGGNNNNFRTLEECTRTCVSRDESSLTRRKNWNETNLGKKNTTVEEEVEGNINRTNEWIRIPMPAKAPEIIDLTRDVTSALSLERDPAIVITGNFNDNETTDKDGDKFDAKNKEKSKEKEQQGKEVQRKERARRKLEKEARKRARKVKKLEQKRLRKLARERRRRDKMERKREREIRKRMKKEQGKTKLKDRNVVETNVSVAIPAKIIGIEPPPTRAATDLRRQRELETQERRQQQQQQKYRQQQQRQEQERRQRERWTRRQEKRQDKTKNEIDQEAKPQALRDNKTNRQLTPLELGPYFISRSSPLPIARDASRTSSDPADPTALSSLGRYASRKWLIDDRFGLRQTNNNAQSRRERKKRRRRRRRRERMDRERLVWSNLVEGRKMSDSGDLNRRFNDVRYQDKRSRQKHRSHASPRNDGRKYNHPNGRRRQVDFEDKPQLTLFDVLA